MLLKCNECSCCPKQHLIFFFLQGQLFSDGNNPVIPCHQESRENSSTLHAALGALGEGKTATESCLGALSSKETFFPPPCTFGSLQAGKYFCSLQVVTAMAAYVPQL